MWTAAEIMHAVDFAHRKHLRAPSMEQPQYNMLTRRHFEKELAIVFKELGYGSTTWSPLATGILTGKYNDGTAPEGSRAALPNFEWLKKRIFVPEKLETTRKLGLIAADLGVPLATMALAWCLKNPNVSTVITGASRVEQVRENMKAADVVDMLDEGVMTRIEDVLKEYQEPVEED
jgi:aryl-alcohol dehydrogenase-like predicted oxidoreductase